ncbi:alpha/beta hydrolase [Nocardia transvalensis]|uniref:alpha/beta hydrolase n=1 Tax=Nocardia transvalensis TaxID=37333 RepID=UPI001894F2CA|nr:alpha/beta hydrolase [Nocardia transvalensis]MBF6333098.1 alpha/beta fold hydrolase [Nocardia transvalensis]
MRHKQAVVTLAAVASVLAAACAAPDRPGDATTDLTRFYTQRPQWTACANDRLDRAGAQCAQITVPLNYQQPQGETIAVTISRLAADPARRHGVMLSNPGGPGDPGLEFTLDIAPALPEDVRSRYDLIGMDPRGVGRSAPVSCGGPTGFPLRSAGVDPAGFDESAAAQRDLAQRCLTAGGERLPYLNTRNTARDMDVIRAVLGVDRISYFGTSYGTYLGAVYTQMFADHSDRIVLDSVLGPARYGMGMVQDMGAPNEAALDAWAEWTAARNDEYRLGATGSEVRAAVTELIQRAAHTPIRIGAHVIDDHWLPVLLWVRLADPARYQMLAEEIRQLTDAAAGAQRQPDDELDSALSTMLTGRPHDASAVAALMCADVPFPRDIEWYRRAVEASRATQPVFGPLVNNMPGCAFWPDPVEPPTAVHNATPALMVQATGDTRAAYAGAGALHREMTASRLVTLKDVAVHGIFGTYRNRCVETAIGSYFRDGTLPSADITCVAD